MSDVFQIQLDNDASETDRGWSVFGLNTTPFPDSGVGSPVLYTHHLTAELQRLNQWMQDAASGGAAPMALFGSLGVGKSHVLRYLEEGLQSKRTTPAISVPLTARGMERITLADLLIRSLPRLGEQLEPPVTAIMAANPEKLRQAVLALSAGDPLREPLLRLQSLDGDERKRGTETLERWLRREYTTPSRRAKVGLGGTMRTEGEALLCVSNLLMVARSVGLLSAWFVLIDQLEELWRPGVVTATRRARFLTDLRTLADLALAGSPIGLLIAWNTTIEGKSVQKVQALLDRDYRALWQRFADKNRVDLPTLGSDDIWPFAKKYLASAGVSAASSHEGRRRLFQQLEARQSIVLERLNKKNPERDGNHPARRVLEGWGDLAEELLAEAVE